MPFLSSRAMAMWMVLLVTPALFSLNMLISRLVAGWLPPVNLTFWRWFLTALFAGAIAGSQLAASLPVMRREWRRLLVLGAIGMSVCGLSAYKAGTRVLQNKTGRVYECKPEPYAGWCRVWSASNTAYEPGVGAAWADAWILR